MLMSAKVTKGLHDIINEFIGVLDERFPDIIQGVYIYGSAVLGDFHFSKSDIDFIVLSDIEFTEEDVRIIEEIHSFMEKTQKRPNLNGIYITWDKIGKLQDEISPYPYTCDGKVDVGYFECNGVTWFQLKNQAKCFRNTIKYVMDFNIDMDKLLWELIDNMNSYWKGILQKYKKYAVTHGAINSIINEDIEWSVLGVSRQYYTFKEKNVVCKAEAGIYAIDNVPYRFNKILQEALNIRREEGDSLYRSKVKRLKDTIDFMEYVIKECNDIMMGKRDGV